MRKFGLIGFPLGHSFSKRFFEEKFKSEHIENCSYDLFPIENLSDFENILDKNPELCGLNVTIPHKIGIMYYLDKVETAAKEIDAVNCIKIINESAIESYFSGEFKPHKVRLEGYNTDAYGFEASLKPLLKKHHSKALVLGSGGASRAVIYVLEKLGIDFKIVSRRKTRKQITYAEVSPELIKEYTIIINTSPVGMSPNSEAYPDIPYEFITDRHLLYDLVYNPAETAFMKLGKQQGAQTKNGEEMLHLQAERSWEIWNND